MKLPFNIRLISTILVIAFVYHDISWAHPDKLQIELRTTRDDFKSTFSAKWMLEKAESVRKSINSLNPSSLEDIKKWTEAQKDKSLSFDEVRRGVRNNLAEILIKIGNGGDVVLRYCRNNTDRLRLPEGFVLQTSYDSQKLFSQLLYTQSFYDRLMSGSASVSEAKPTTLPFVAPTQTPRQQYEPLSRQSAAGERPADINILDIIARNPSLKNVYASAEQLIKGGTIGVDRVLDLTLRPYKLDKDGSERYREQEEFLGEIVEAAALQNGIKYSKVLELNVERYGSEMDCIIEVSRSKYAANTVGQSELDDGYYLVESKTHDKYDDLNKVVDQLMEGAMKEMSRKRSRTKLENFTLNAIRMKKEGYNVKGIIFAIGGEIIPYHGIHRFSLIEREPEEGVKILNLKVYEAHIPDTIIERTGNGLKPREERFVADVIADLLKAGKIGQENEQRFSDVLRSAMAKLGIYRVQVVIMETLKNAGADPINRARQGVSHWNKVFEALKEAGTKPEGPRQSATGQEQLARAVGDTIYEVNARALAEEYKASHGGEEFRFSKITDADLEKWRDEYGATVIWFMGVWEISRYSKILNQGYDANRVGSAYSISDYKIAKDLGGEDDFRVLVKRANRLGLKIMLDVIPNHMAADTPLLKSRPEYFMSLAANLPEEDSVSQKSAKDLINRFRDKLKLIKANNPCPIFQAGTEELSETDWTTSSVSKSAMPRWTFFIRTAWTWGMENIIKHKTAAPEPAPENAFYFGRDTPFTYEMGTPWVDVVQFNYTNEDMRNYMKDVIFKVADLTNGGGIRFDVLYLTLRSKIRENWFGHLSYEEFNRRYPEDREFWRTVIPELKAKYPNIVLLGELYGSHFDGNTAYDLGLDYYYEDGFIRYMETRNVRGLKDFLKTYVSESGRTNFIKWVENHDTDERIVVLLARSPAIGQGAALPASLATATLLYTLPGASLVYRGQELGRSLWMPKADYIRGPPEEDNPHVVKHYKELGNIVRDNRDIFNLGSFKLLDIGNADDIVAFEREHNGRKAVTIVNYSPKGSGELKFIIDGEELKLDLPPWGSHIYIFANGTRVFEKELPAVSGTGRASTSPSTGEAEPRRSTSGAEPEGPSKKPQSNGWGYDIDFKKVKKVMKKAGETLKESEEKFLFLALHADNLSAEERKELQDFLIVKNMPLVTYLAKLKGCVGDKLDDAIQNGIIGLMKAVKGFDYRKGYRFSTYANRAITWSISRRGISSKKLRKRAPTKNQLDKLDSVKSAILRLSKELGREPTIEELAEAMKMSEKKVRRILLQAKPPELEPLLPTHIADLTDRSPGPLEEAIAREEEPIKKAEILNRLSWLDRRHQIIIKMVYGIGTVGDKAYTLGGIGLLLGLSKERVRQLKDAAVAIMKGARKPPKDVTPAKVSEDHADVFLVEVAGKRLDSEGFEEMAAKGLAALKEEFPGEDRASTSGAEPDASRAADFQESYVSSANRAIELLKRNVKMMQNEKLKHLLNNEILIDLLIRPRVIKEIDIQTDNEMPLKYLLNIFNEMVGMDFFVLEIKGKLYIYSDGYLRDRLQGQTLSKISFINRITERMLNQDEVIVRLLDQEIPGLPNPDETHALFRATRIPNKLRDIVVPTADRDPKNLERLIRSILANLDDFGYKGITITVIDTSRDDNIAKGNQQVLAAFSREGITFNYKGWEQIRNDILNPMESRLEGKAKEAFHEVYVEPFINKDRKGLHPADAIDMGQMRNMIAFYYGKKPYLSLDDDIELRMRFPPLDRYAELLAKDKEDIFIDPDVGVVRDYMDKSYVAYSEFRDETIAIPSDMIGIADRNLNEPRALRPYRIVGADQNIQHVDESSITSRIVYYFAGGSLNPMDFFDSYFRTKKFSDFIGAESDQYLVLSAPAAHFTRGLTNWTAVATSLELSKTPSLSAPPYEDVAWFNLMWLAYPSDLQLQTGAFVHERYAQGRGNPILRYLTLTSATFVIGDFLYSTFPSEIIADVLKRNRGADIFKALGEEMLNRSEAGYQLSKIKIESCYKRLRELAKLIKTDARNYPELNAQLKPLEGYVKKLVSDKSFFEQEIMEYLRRYLRKNGLVLTYWQDFANAAMKPFPAALGEVRASTSGAEPEGPSQEPSPLSPQNRSRRYRIRTAEQRSANRAELRRLLNEAPHTINELSDKTGFPYALVNADLKQIGLADHPNLKKESNPRSDEEIRSDRAQLKVLLDSGLYTARELFEKTGIPIKAVRDDLRSPVLKNHPNLMSHSGKDVRNLKNLLDRGPHTPNQLSELSGINIGIVRKRLYRYSILGLHPNLIKERDLRSHEKRQSDRALIRTLLDAGPHTVQELALKVNTPVETVRNSDIYPNAELRNHPNLVKEVIQRSPEKREADIARIKALLEEGIHSARELSNKTGIPYETIKSDLSRTRLGQHPNRRIVHATRNSEQRKKDRALLKSLLDAGPHNAIELSIESGIPIDMVRHDLLRIAALRDHPNRRFLKDKFKKYGVTTRSVVPAYTFSVDSLPEDDLELLDLIENRLDGNRLLVIKADLLSDISDEVLAQKLGTSPENLQVIRKDACSILEKSFSARIAENVKLSDADVEILRNRYGLLWRGLHGERFEFFSGDQRQLACFAYITTGKSGEIINDAGIISCNYIIIFDKKQKVGALIHTDLRTKIEDAEEVIRRTCDMLKIDLKDKEYIKNSVSTIIVRGIAEHEISQEIESYFVSAIDELGLPRLQTDVDQAWWLNPVSFLPDEGLLLALSSEAEGGGSVLRALKLYEPKGPRQDGGGSRDKRASTSGASREELSPKKVGRPSIISKRLSQFGKERLNGLNITQAAKLMGISQSGLSYHLQKHRGDFDTYGIEKEEPVIPALLQFFGKEKLNGLNIPQAAKLMGISKRGLSHHLQKHSGDFDTYGIKQRVDIPALLQSFGKERLNGLNITQAAKLMEISKTGLTGYLQKHRGDFDTYGIEKEEPVIPALLQSFGKEKLNGLNITQAAKLMGISQTGLSHHLQKHSGDFDTYGIEQRVDIPALLRSFGRKRLKGLNITQAAKLMGISQSGLSRHLKYNSRDSKRYGFKEEKSIIPALLRSFGRKRLKGLNITQAAKLMGISQSGLSRHLKYDSRDFKRYGMVKGSTYNIARTKRPIYTEETISALKKAGGDIEKATNLLGLPVRGLYIRIGEIRITASESGDTRTLKRLDNALSKKPTPGVDSGEIRASTSGANRIQSLIDELRRADKDDISTLQHIVATMQANADVRDIPVLQEAYVSFEPGIKRSITRDAILHINKYKLTVLHEKAQMEILRGPFIAEASNLSTTIAWKIIEDGLVKVVADFGSSDSTALLPIMDEVDKAGRNDMTYIELDYYSTLIHVKDDDGSETIFDINGNVVQLWDVDGKKLSEMLRGSPAPEAIRRAQKYSAYRQKIENALTKKYGGDVLSRVHVSEKGIRNEHVTLRGLYVRLIHPINPQAAERAVETGRIIFAQCDMFNPERTPIVQDMAGKIDFALSRNVLGRDVKLYSADDSKNAARVIGNLLRENGTLFIGSEIHSHEQYLWMRRAGAKLLPDTTSFSEEPPTEFTKPIILSTGTGPRQDDGSSRGRRASMSGADAEKEPLPAAVLAGLSGYRNIYIQMAQLRDGHALADVKDLNAKKTIIFADIYQYAVFKFKRLLGFAGLKLDIKGISMFIETYLHNLSLFFIHNFQRLGWIALASQETVRETLYDFIRRVDSFFNLMLGQPPLLYPQLGMVGVNNHAQHITLSDIASQGKFIQAAVPQPAVPTAAEPETRSSATGDAGTGLGLPREPSPEQSPTAQSEFAKIKEELIDDYMKNIGDPSSYVQFALPALLAKVKDIDTLKLCKELIDDYRKNIGDPSGYVQFTLPALLAKVKDIDTLKLCKELINDYRENIGNPRHYVQFTLPALLAKVKDIEELRAWDKLCKELIDDYRENLGNLYEYVRYLLPALLDEVKDINTLKLCKELIDDYRENIGDPCHYVQFTLPALLAKVKDIEELRAWDKLCKELIDDYRENLGNLYEYVRYLLPALLDEVKDINTLKLCKELIDDYRENIGDPYNYVQFTLPALLAKVKDIEELRAWGKLCKELINDYRKNIEDPSGYVGDALPALLDEVKDINTLKLCKELIDGYMKNIGDPYNYVQFTLPALLAKVKDIEELRAWDKLCKELIDDYRENIGNPSSYVRDALPALLDKMGDIEIFKVPWLYAPVRLITERSKYPGGYVTTKADSKALAREIRKGHIVKIGDRYYFPIKNPLRPANGIHNRSLVLEANGRSIIYKGTGASQHFDIEGVITNFGKGIHPHILYGGLPESESSMDVDRLLRRLYTSLNNRKDPALALAKRYGAKIDMIMYPIALAALKAIPVVEAKNLSEKGKELLEKGATPPEGLSMPEGVKLIPKEAFLDFIDIPRENEEERSPAIYVYSVPFNVRLSELADLRNMAPIFNYYGYQVTYGEDGSITRITRKGEEVRYEVAAQEILHSAAARYALFSHMLHHHLNACARNEYGTVFGPQNVNPITLFDYDTIRFDLEEDERKESYEKDISDAKLMIENLAYKLKISPDKAFSIFDEIYHKEATAQPAGPSARASTSPSTSLGASAEQRRSTSGAVAEDNIAHTLESLNRLFKETSVSDTAQVLLSESLFIKDGDGAELNDVRLALQSVLSAGHIAILPPEEVRRRAINRNASKERLAIILTKEDFDDKAIWNGSDKEISLRASVLILDDKLIGTHYLYLEGVIGLARAIMANNKQSIKSFFKTLTGIILDDKLLELLDDGRENTLSFAIKAILKFKPIERIDGEELRNYRIIMENYLIAA